VLDEYEPPTLASETRLAMDEFVARRLAEGGAPPD
jgi:trimethylamine:corrinoid methyltransferase-like protein